MSKPATPSPDSVSGSEGASEGNSEVASEPKDSKPITEVRELEQKLTDIWRPLFDPNINAQEMAYLIRACKDESMTLLKVANSRPLEATPTETAILEARIKVLSQWARFFEDPSMNAMTPSERLWKEVAQLQAQLHKKQA